MLLERNAHAVKGEEHPPPAAPALMLSGDGGVPLGKVGENCADQALPCGTAHARGEREGRGELGSDREGFADGAVALARRVFVPGGIGWGETNLSPDVCVRVDDDDA